MARRPLPRILSSGSAQIARSRQFARTAADSATDVLHPLITISRGLRRLAALGRQKWIATPKERRGSALFLLAACLFAVALIPYGPLLVLIAVMGAAAWSGRDRTPVRTGPTDAETARLQAVYEALVPYFSVPEDPAPLYAHDGEWSRAFQAYEFDDDGRPTLLRLRYPAYFTDGEAESRARVEQLLRAKSGRGREYLFDWSEEENELVMSVLPALCATIAAQRFVIAPGETVLGFTDPSGVQRTVPVLDGDRTRDVPPVVWRTGVRSTEPHLLAAGQPGSGTTTLLRSIALQALQHGDVLVIDGNGTGEYACLAGRAGVLAVESGLSGTLATLEWASHETERRLIAANQARQAGHPVPEDVRRPLWILFDLPNALAHLAAAGRRPDPCALLTVPLRHGRAAGVTVVVAEHLDAVESLPESVRSHTRARVVLGPASSDRIEAVLGAPPHTTPTPDMPPGRGYARFASGATHRLQVPATPDPYDESAPDAHRRAVLALLPERCTAGAEAAAGTAAETADNTARGPLAPVTAAVPATAPAAKPPEAAKSPGTVRVQAPGATEHPEGCGAPRPGKKPAVATTAFGTTDSTEATDTAGTPAKRTAVAES
ncbi:hypothetical protein [Streptomyces sp. GC420]|uniref:hypothetical protein n=1 Tax=Streptomyces sp. GC420 TaxID=2697568 RepID=UPI0028BF305A|nr:hypothetical protein [Streptomyces sp. GC420]